MPKTSQGLSFSRNTTYYRQVTHEFNLPAGWACPGAKDCLTKVDRDTGKRTTRGPEFLCYAAVSERYPNVRNQRWANFGLVKQLCKDDAAVIELPKNATHVRIHGSGDFFNPRYLRLWIRTGRGEPGSQVLGLYQVDQLPGGLPRRWWRVAGQLRDSSLARVEA